MIKSNPIILREAEAVIENGQAIVQFPELDIEPERFTGLSIKVFPDSTFRHKYTVVQAISYVSDAEYDEYQRAAAQTMAEHLEELGDDEV